MAIDKSEKALQARDDRVEKAIREKYEDLKGELDAHEREVRCLRSRISWLKSVVEKETWYELRGIITRDDIESLCEVSPTHLIEEW